MILKKFIETLATHSLIEHEVTKFVYGIKSLDKIDLLVGKSCIKKYPKQDCVTAIRLRQQLVGYLKKIEYKKEYCIGLFSMN